VSRLSLTLWKCDGSTPNGLPPHIYIYCLGYLVPPVYFIPMVGPGATISATGYKYPMKQPNEAYAQRIGYGSHL
jgi:hypothetical protein